MAAPPIPTIHISRASIGPLPPPTWTCCHCLTPHPLSLYTGPHPLGQLRCPCPHHPCSTCASSGQITPFLPIEEPAMVPCSELSDVGTPLVSPETGIPFGIVCAHCGVSWRARQSGKRFSKRIRKMRSSILAPGLSMGMGVGEKSGKVRRTRSNLVLREKNVEAVGEEQAEYVAVRFSGGMCLCGRVIELGEAFCFQIRGSERVDEKERVFREMWAGRGISRGWYTTEELRAKGHGMGEVRLMGGRVVHVNPLRGNPVVDREARESWEEKCVSKGWV